MIGKCLCGAVQFELSGTVPNLYQCHCSLCRKVTGSSANAAFRIAAAQFEWRCDIGLIHQFESDSGFKSHFCSRCGSPVPNLTRADQEYWVPVGLLEEDQELSLVAHLFLGSRAGWDLVADAGEHFAEMPDSDVLDGLLKPAKAVP